MNLHLSGKNTCTLTEYYELQNILYVLQQKITSPTNHLLNLVSLHKMLLLLQLN